MKLKIILSSLLSFKLAIAQFEFPNFTGADNLLIVGDSSSRNSNVIRLMSMQPNQAGRAFFQDALTLNDQSFSTFFPKRLKTASQILKLQEDSDTMDSAQVLELNSIPFLTQKFRLEVATMSPMVITLELMRTLVFLNLRLLLESNPNPSPMVKSGAVGLTTMG